MCTGVWGQVPDPLVDQTMSKGQLWAQILKVACLLVGRAISLPGQWSGLRHSSTRAYRLVGRGKAGS